MVRPDDAFDETPVYVTVSAFMVAPHCPTTVKVYAICVTSYTHLCLRSFLVCFGKIHRVLARVQGVCSSSRRSQPPETKVQLFHKDIDCPMRLVDVPGESWDYGTDTSVCVSCTCTYVYVLLSYLWTWLLYIIMIVDYVYLTTIYTCFVLFSEFFWYSPRRQVSRSICKCRRFDWHSCSFHQRHGYEKVVTTVCSMELINLWNEPTTPTFFLKITSTSRLDSGLSRGNRLTTRIALSFIKLASRERPQQI